jgi:hypothetical protein
MDAAEDLKKSDDTVRRAIATVEEARKTGSGRFALKYLEKRKGTDT